MLCINSEYSIALIKIRYILENKTKQKNQTCSFFFYTVKTFFSHIGNKKERSEENNVGEETNNILIIMVPIRNDMKGISTRGIITSLPLAFQTKGF